MDYSDSYLIKLWKDKTWAGSFTGVKTFQLLLKTDKNISVSEKRLLKLLKEEPLYLKHLRPRRKLFRRRYNLSYYGELIQADIAYMFEYESFKYFLVLIDCFSFKCFTSPLKTKTASEVLKSFQTLLKKFNCNVTKVQVDQGTEFSLVKKLCKQEHIIFQYKFGKNKANFAEWIIMMIKRRLYKAMRNDLDFDWPSLVDKIAQQFNITPQKKLGYLQPNQINSIYDTDLVKKARLDHNMTPFPFEITTYEEKIKNQALYEAQAHKNFQVGDFVYLDFNQSLFGKSFDIQVLTLL